MRCATAAVLILSLHARDVSSAFVTPLTFPAAQQQYSAVVMVSEMEWRRRQSGDPASLRKSAEDALDAASDAQAQRWLKLGGDSVAPPESAKEILDAAIETAKASNVGADADAMKRAVALFNAVNGWRMPSTSPGASRVLKKKVTDGFAQSTLQQFAGSGFDGTRQGVQRARKLDLQKRQQNGGAERIDSEVSATIRAQDALADGVRLVQGMPPEQAASELSSYIAEAKKAGLSSNAPAMKKAVALANVLSTPSAEAVEEQVEQSDEPPTSTSAVLDALFSGYAEPGPLIDDE